MLKHIGVECRTDARGDDHTHGEHDADPGGHEAVRHALVGYRGDERIEQHHSRRTDNDRPFHTLIHAVVLHLEIHKEGVASDKEEAQTVHPLQMNILGSGDDRKDQAHGISHHHPVAQGGILPVVYLHSHIGEYIHEHGAGVADHQEEEQHDAVIDNPELEYLHDKIR